MLRLEPERRGSRGGVSSISDLSDRTLAMNGLSDETAAISMWSFAGYDQFGATMRTAGTGVRRVRAQKVERTDRQSTFIGNNLSSNIFCCIIMNLLK